MFEVQDCIKWIKTKRVIIVSIVNVIKGYNTNRLFHPNAPYKLAFYKSCQLSNCKFNTANEILTFT